MAAGDFDSGSGIVGADETVDIRPGENLVVWNVKEIHVGGAWELYHYDGSNLSKIDAWPSSKTLTKLQMQVERDDYYQLKNVSSASVKYYFKYGVLK